MKTGALVFLAAFVALSASWGAFVLGPQLQLGRGDQARTVPAADAYPAARPGLARQGADVYRSLGCVYCHSQQVGQANTIGEIILTDAGTNTATALAMLAKYNPELVKIKGPKLFDALPVTILDVSRTAAARPVVKDLETVGAKAQVWVSQQGPDLARAWGRRATVAQDFLFDDLVQPGTRRIGPDLANIALRKSDVNWHLRHLYAPKSEVKDSTMPPYGFLFETRKVVGRPSPEALQLTGEFAPKPGKNGEVYEVVPKESALALAAYLTSLRADPPLFEAPFTVPAEAPPATNAPPK